jgi:hypothetical protein
VLCEKRQLQLVIKLHFVFATIVVRHDDGSLCSLLLMLDVVKNLKGEVSVSVCLVMLAIPSFALSFAFSAQTNDRQHSIKSVEDDVCLLCLVYFAHVPLDSLLALRIERLIPTFVTLQTSIDL